MCLCVGGSQQQQYCPCYSRTNATFLINIFFFASISLILSLCIRISHQRTRRNGFKAVQKPQKVLTIIASNLSCGQPIFCTLSFSLSLSYTGKVYYKTHSVSSWPSSHLMFRYFFFLLILFQQYKLRISRVIVFAYVFIFGKCYSFLHIQFPFPSRCMLANMKKNCAICSPKLKKKKLPRDSTHTHTHIYTLSIVIAHSWQSVHVRL